MNKKITLPILLTLGTLSISCLIASALISNSNSITNNNNNNNNNNSLTSNMKIAKPIVPSNGFIWPDWVAELVAYKNTIPGWDGSLVESDFVGAKVIYNDAFSYVIGLTSVTLPKSVTDIKSRAFNGNTSIKYISALGVTSIDPNAFAGTTSIVEKGISLTFNTNISVNEINRWGTNLKYVYIKPTKPYPEVPGGIITKAFIGQLTFFRAQWTSALGDFDGVFYPHELIGATSVADNAFGSNTQLKSITLPDTVTSIGTSAFQGASNLTTISALGVTNINNGAFAAIPRIANNGIKLTYSLNIKIGRASCRERVCLYV